MDPDGSIWNNSSNLTLIQNWKENWIAVLQPEIPVFELQHLKGQKHVRSNWDLLHGGSEDSEFHAGGILVCFETLSVFAGGPCVRSSMMYVSMQLVADGVYHPWALRSKLWVLLFSRCLSFSFFSPVWSCFASWTQPCHAEPPLCPFYQGERPGHALHTCSFQITVSYAHLFSISCRMGWWCSVLRIVTRRNTWLPCYTSQYEHHSSLSPSVLGQCSLRRKCFSSPNVFLLCAVANELWLHVVSETSGSPTFALFSWSYCGSSWKWQLRVS